MSFQHHIQRSAKAKDDPFAGHAKPKLEQSSGARQLASAESVMSPANMMQLQRTVGNQALQRMLASQSTLQREEGPELEEEELQMKADPNAIQREEGPELEEEELQMKADPNAIQREEGPELEEEELQMKADPNAIQREEGPELEEEELQMKADPNAIQREEGPELEEEELQMKADPNKMPPSVQSKMESAFNSDFSDVTIHEGSEASDVGALAYAQGSDIHFAPGQYDPGSKQGQQLLGHELTHVVQQRQGAVKPTTEVNGLAVNDDPKLENEADQMGKKAAELPEVNI